MKTILKWIGYLALGMVAIALIITLSPLFLIAGGIAWYVFNKQDRIRLASFSKYLTIASAVGVLFLVISLVMPSEEPTTNQQFATEQVSTEQVSQEPIQVSESAQADESAETESESSGESSEEPSEEESEVTFDDEREQIAYDTLEDDLLDFSVVEDDSGFTTLNISVQNNVTLNESTALLTFHDKVTRLAEALQDQEFDRMIVTGIADAQDMYGNETETPIGNITLYKDTINQINFDNFNPENLPAIADNYTTRLESNEDSD